jgi:hypothetical protein
VLSRAWYVLGGLGLAVALAGVGYYFGFSHEAARWASERAAIADSSDSARPRAARTTRGLDSVSTSLDSAIAAVKRGAAAAHPREPALLIVHDTVRVPVDTAPSSAVPLARGSARDTSAATPSASPTACSALVDAAMRYRTACEAVRDSLTRLLMLEAARPAPARSRQLGVVLGPGLSVTSDGRAHVALNLTGGWRLW